MTKRKKNRERDRAYDQWIRDASEMSPWERLAGAIVITAAQDYRTDPDAREEIRLFFKSGFLDLVFSGDPQEFIGMLDAEIEKEQNGEVVER